jgi:two-component system, OmpR family, sensor kinase
VARLPVRMRLALAFAVVMAAVLVGVGAFLYIRLAHELDRSIDQSLRSRASDLAGVVQADDGGLGEAGTARLLESDESFAQVIAPGGRVIGATAPTAEAPLLSPLEIARAARSTIVLERKTTPVGDEPVRLLATPVDARGVPVIVVVGASTGDRAEALDSLRRLLFIGGPIALVLASVAGYALAAAALRPVDAMRRRADTITSAGDAQRLPVPPAHDELSDLARTLNAMLDRIDAAAERERRFVADASHELRRPVTSLKAELEVAVRRARSRDELHAALLSAVADADVLAHLADDLLLLASARDGGLPLRRAPLEVAELLEGVARRFALRAEAVRRRIVVGPVEPVGISADRLRLEQALDNLVDNALRHGAGAVTLAARRRDAVLDLTVADEGSGLPDAFLQHAFERFRRADDARTGEGAGLGLAIVKAVAEAHGGAASIRNVDGAGALATISIPLATADDG